MSTCTLFATHAISNFLTWISRYVLDPPWKWGRLTTLYILGGGFLGMLKVCIKFVFTCGVFCGSNGLVCIIIVRLT